MLYAYDSLTERLRSAGDWLAPVGLRLILFYEFWRAGTGKLNGSNWFVNIQSDFPFPVNLVSPELSWALATWTEVIASLALLLGLFTRFFAMTLVILTAVAIVAVHWPAEWSDLAELWKGYAISDDGYGNYKMPLIFTVMLLPLVFHGGGKLGADHLLLKVTGRSPLIHDRTGGYGALAAALVVTGIPAVFLFPVAGGAVLTLGVVVGLYTLLGGRH